MKKIVAIALVVVSLCAVGCGGDAAKKPAATGGAVATGSGAAK